MIKTLVIIRHAKAEPQQQEQKDFDRNLTDRGRKDAATMAGRLKDAGILPELILSSTASRTRQTSSIIAAATGYAESCIQAEGKLYNSSSDTIEHMLMNIPASINTCYLVAHNPGVSQYVYEAQKTLFIGDMPTAAVVVLRFEADDWQDLPLVKKQLVLFNHPQL